LGKATDCPVWLASVLRKSTGSNVHGSSMMIRLGSAVRTAWDSVRKGAACVPALESLPVEGRT
jgi:hypothetical protein